jgi:putative CocE/NonD family hydrolase
VVVTDFPRRVREIENIFIPLADGTRLAARIFLPEDAETHPVPAILEYLPYRKRDGTAERDALTHPYFAGHGYAGIRVDMRGSGESEGLLVDEYPKQEQDDCLEIIAWIARQSWCSGAVGMMGISWGGFNALQVAARRPPALKAIITICSTDDRYADDIHFMGGALLNAKLGWASTMFAYMSRPPDPALVGERWREMWLERLEAMPLFIETWLQHQRRDEYWKHGSICEDFAQIACPVYAIGGWADGYSNAVPRLLAGLTVPRKGLIGPWAHKYPHFALPAPAFGFLQEALRWWDKWLKGTETGVMEGPMLRAYVQESVRPLPWYAERPGRWVGEAAWPSTAITQRAVYLLGQSLADKAGDETPLQLASPETAGLCAGDWLSFGTTPEEPVDQREDDAKSLVFDSEPLASRVELLGAAAVELDLASDKPNAIIAVRLCDVHPDGAATRITYGILNLSHRDSHEHPTPLEPGKRYRIRVQLNDVGYALPSGHRLRLAISSAYWPILWPLPERATLTLYAGSTSRLLLPLRAPRAEDAQLPPLPPVASATPEPRTVLRAGEIERRIERDIATGETIVHRLTDNGEVRIDAIGLEISSAEREEYRITDEDPLSARIEIVWTQRVGRGAWRTRTETRTVMTATRDEFHLHAELDAYEGETRVVSRNWDRKVPRDLI